MSIINFPYPAPEPNITQTQKLNLLKWQFPKFKLNKKFHYGWHDGYAAKHFIIPAGYEYDGATFGWLLFWRRPADHRAAIAHDYIYEQKGYVALTTDNVTNVQKIKRKYADKLFFEELKQVLNVQSWRRYLAYPFVRWGGYLFWREW